MASEMVDPAAGAATAPTGDSGSEHQRLAALRNLGLLDTPPAEAFDRITRLAARLFDAPIVLISLVDESRQWFKSRFGLDVPQTPREISFCTHVVQQRRPMAVGDASKDTRFAANPLVTGFPHIRAYAGIPVFTRMGHAIGTLCVIDHRAREFSADDMTALGDLATMLQDTIRGLEVAAQTDGVLQYARDREKLFRDTFELASVGMAHAALDGVLLRTNRHACEMLGYEEHGLDQVSVVDLTHPDDLVRATTAFRRLTGGQVDEYRIEKRLQRRGGDFIWCQLSVALKRAQGGQPEFLIAVIEDIENRHEVGDELLQARDTLRLDVAAHAHRLQENNDALRAHVKHLLESEHAVRRVEHRMRGIADIVPAMIGYWNRELRCEFANEAYRNWFDGAPQNIVGVSMRELMGDARFEANEPHARLALAGQAQRFELSVPRADGLQSFIDVRYAPDVDEENVTCGFFVLATDTTPAHDAQLALDAANAKLSSESVTDFLTGLGNRRSFTRRGEETAKSGRKERQSYGILILHLDRLQEINERCGHDAGDEVLRSVSKLFRQQIRSPLDLAARLGGRSFGLLYVDEVDEARLMQSAQQLRSQIQTLPFAGAATALRPSASIGIALAAADAAEWQTVFANADLAMEEARGAGGDRIVSGRSHGRAAAHPVR
jgi:diguanylate cyclase (GGDEF)-like protein/PAS domain S-box-containing protein